MRVTVTEAADEFARRAGELLASSVEHNVLATVLALLAGSSSRGTLFAYVENDRGDVIAAALRTPPRRMIATVMDPAAADALMRAWLARDPELPGVGAPREVARRLACAWEQCTGGSATLTIAEALHTLERVRDPARPASGRLRAGGSEDRELLIRWICDFAVEAGLSDSADADRIVDTRLGRGLLHLWEDGGPVAMVGDNPPVAGVVRIGPVYTPPALRSRGYASSAVAAVSRSALEQGARRCMLYTDLANPTSNRIYAALGYRRVAEWEEFGFTARGHEAPNPRPS